MVRYKMVGRDFNAFPVQYRTWVVNDTPDFDGYYYTGLKSGPEPFIDVSAYSILDDNAVVDFSLPNPTSWSRTYAVLPDVIYNSQLAVLDGYAYLFGGTTDGMGEDGYGTTSKIYVVDLNRPTEWRDSGASLPTPLCLSQLAVIGNTIYLFGGMKGGEAVDVIYSAPTSNPLNWTNTGNTIPKKLHSSTLGMTSSFVYLYGGFEINFASDNIFRAPIGSPLNWTQQASVLPTKLYNSQIGFLDGYFFLFGGQISPDTPTANIYRTALNSHTTVTVVGSLPAPACNGQFFTVAGKGYLIGPSSTSNNVTNIFKCDTLTPASWVDVDSFPGQVARSQMAIIGDRLFFFGGNGSTVIWADNPTLKYSLTNSLVLKYGDITRTQFDAISNPLDYLALLGFPWWKTNYGG